MHLPNFPTWAEERKPRKRNKAGKFKVNTKEVMKKPVLENKEGWTTKTRETKTYLNKGRNEHARNEKNDSQETWKQRKPGRQKKKNYYKKRKKKLARKRKRKEARKKKWWEGRRRVLNQDRSRLFPHFAAVLTLSANPASASQLSLPPVLSVKILWELGDFKKVPFSFWSKLRKKELPYFLMLKYLAPFQP